VSRVFLSAPDVRGGERDLLLDALDSNWVAPLGPHVDAFEEEAAAACQRAHGAAMSSGTAALHLALQLVGVTAGSEVLMPTLTFVATANAARYLGAQPVLLDVDPTTWNLDPGLLADELDRLARTSNLPSAVVAVDLYGQCADYATISALCADYEIPLVVDAAESLGAEHEGRAAGSAGTVAILSFNGNKIVTCGGGGMLVADDADLVGRARWLAAQAREPGSAYSHVELGYNYRLSNLLAAVGRGQLKELAARVSDRRTINERYRHALGGLPGVGFMPIDPRGRPNSWLTCLTLDPANSPITPDELVARLEAEDIEARPAWRPMHLQPLHAGCRTRLTGAAEAVARQGVCLPSGSGLTAVDLDRVIEATGAALCPV
jgi:dTDP-4-amino-4,6-dideoxygalactose transaminase